MVYVCTDNTVYKLIHTVDTSSPLLSTTVYSCLSELQELKETEELDIQLKVFNENKEEDSIELSHRLDDIRAEMEYPFVRLRHCTGHGKGLLEMSVLCRPYQAYRSKAGMVGFIREEFEDL